MSSFHSRILIIDDEQGLIEMLETLLKKEGFTQVDAALDADQAIQKVQHHAVDLILLDVMLPDLDGFTLCQQLRQHTLAPIIFLTARSTQFDKVMGLGIGGDDYITKPFHPLEVVARIRAHLRRQQLQTQSDSPSNKQWLSFGSLTMDLLAGELWLEERKVSCTAKEFELLAFFMKHPNQLFTTQHLYEQVWGALSNGVEKTVVIHISKLRKKIEPYPQHPSILINVRGLGYKFIPPSKGA